MIKALVVLSGLGIGLSGVPVWAAETRVEVRQEIRQNNDEVKYNKQEVKTQVVGEGNVSVKINGVEMVSPAPGNVSRKTNEEVRTMMETRREEMRRKFEAFKEELQKRRESVKERFSQLRADFELKRQQISDERKQEVLGKIDVRLGEINSKRTEAMTKSLEKMVSILERVTVKVNEAKQAGKNTAGVETAMTSAQSAIAAAQTAVSNQAGKEYVVNITTESELQQNTQTAIRNMQADLKSANAQVVIARKAVSQVLRNLAQVLGEPVPEVVNE